MKCNIGYMGRVWRLVIALVLIAYGFHQSSFLLLGIALFVLYEVWESWCLFHWIFGIDHSQQRSSHWKRAGEQLFRLAVLAAVLLLLFALFKGYLNFV